MAHFQDQPGYKGPGEDIKLETKKPGSEMQWNSTKEYRGPGMIEPKTPSNPDTNAPTAGEKSNTK